MKRKALILGTNAGQADIIEYLNLKGWETHACGYKKEGPGCELAHYFHLVNITNIDAVANLASSIGVDIVYSVSSDLAITAATKVSERLKLPHLLNSILIDLFNNKHLFREFLNKNNIGNTNYNVVNVNNIKDLIWTEFPCVVKPTDSQGQRGVQMVENAEDLTDALVLAMESSQNGDAIIEEYLDGNEFSTNVIIQDGKIIVNEFSDRIVFGTEFFGLPKGHGLPVKSINSEQLAIAKNYVYKIVEKLNITDAVLYIQMKLKAGEPRVIEIAPRLDGCHIWRLIKHYRGIDIREYAIQCLLGEMIDNSNYINEPNMISSVLEFYHLPTQEKFSLDKLNIYENTCYTEYRYKDGDNIVPINGKLEVVGYSIYDES